MEELFCAPPEIFREPPGKAQGRRRETAQTREPFGPEIPERAQWRAAKEKKGCRSQPQARKEEQPQLALAYPQGKEKNEPEQRKSVCPVQCRGKGGPGASVPQGPQQIIQQSQRPAKAGGAEQDAQLPETVDLHPAYPNSRRRKPVRLSVSS